MGIIYCHKNKITGKCYVGQTHSTLEDRIGTKPEVSYKNNKSFSSDIVKYGWNNFESFVLESVADDGILNDRETYWINKIKEKSALYNKHTTGTNNAKSTPLVANRITDMDIEIVVKKFNDGLSIREIRQYVGLSVLSIKKILLNLGYTIPDVGNVDSFSQFLKEERTKFMASIKCPVCGKSYLPSHDMRHLTCDATCQTKYSALSKEQKDEIKEMVSANYSLYKEFMSEINDKRHQHREYVENRITELKIGRAKTVTDSCSTRKRTTKNSVNIGKSITKQHKVVKSKTYVPKHTAEELYWHKDETRCKQKLDLILNSGVDLMKFGYNAKLCKMFPELTKRTILFLLRKYNIPHFERVGSSDKNLNL